MILAKYVAPFTEEQIDYVDYILNFKKLDQNTCLQFIAHKYGIKGLEAVLLIDKAITVDRKRRKNEKH